MFVMYLQKARYKIKGMHVCEKVIESSGYKDVGSKKGKKIIFS